MTNTETGTEAMAAEIMSLRNEVDLLVSSVTSMAVQLSLLQAQQDSSCMAHARWFERLSQRLRPNARNRYPGM